MLHVTCYSKIRIKVRFFPSSYGIAVNCFVGSNSRSQTRTIYRMSVIIYSSFRFMYYMKSFKDASLYFDVVILGL